MSLAKKEIDELIRQISLSKDEEINCDQCLSSVAEFAEQELVGKSAPKALRGVEHHLSICAECHEEYEYLQLALQKMDG